MNNVDVRAKKLQLSNCGTVIVLLWLLNLLSLLVFWEWWRCRRFTNELRHPSLAQSRLVSHARYNWEQIRLHVMLRHWGVLLGHLLLRKQRNRTMSRVHLLIAFRSELIGVTSERSEVGTKGPGGLPLQTSSLEFTKRSRCTSWASVRQFRGLAATKLEMISCQG
jgi:hypothetical protein